MGEPVPPVWAAWGKSSQVLGWSGEALGRGARAFPLVGAVRSGLRCPVGPAGRLHGPGARRLSIPDLSNARPGMIRSARTALSRAPGPAPISDVLAPSGALSADRRDEPGHPSPRRAPRAARTRATRPRAVRAGRFALSEKLTEEG
ncbi:hypothetical protein LV78_000280 [Actinosynnema pretiosum]|nr:hypothetical protein [Actinosynnema pretiosum]